jgi:hypothetical protein
MLSPSREPVVTGRATFSRDHRYRTSLARRWGDGPRICWVMLNPSTADATHDDPTLRRCIAFARAWGAGSIEVVNLFALVSTDPKRLLTEPDAADAANGPAVARAVRRADLVVTGWGNVPTALIARAAKAMRRLPEHTWCLGLTAQGQPRHPLYVAAKTERVPFRPAPGLR